MEGEKKTLTLKWESWPKSVLQLAAPVSGKGRLRRDQPPGLASPLKTKSEHGCF